MYKLQALKGKLSSAAIGTVLAVSLATCGMLPAFAYATNVSESDVFLYRSDDIDPPEDEDMEEGEDYNVNLPVDGLYGLVGQGVADSFTLDYEVIEESVKDYSLELQNNTTFDMYVKNVQVKDPHSALNIVAEVAFTSISEPNTMWTKISSSKGGTAIDVKSALDAGATGMTPVTAEQWTIGRATQAEQQPVPGVLGVVFEGGIKNVDLNAFPPLDDNPAGLKAYTIVWTLGFVK